MKSEGCRLCPRQCGAMRTDNSGGGFCRMPENPVVARCAPHYWEEPVLSGTRGSGAVFFSGCTLGCMFCQNASISAGGFGRTLSVEELGQAFRALIGQGVHNLNLVNPVHFTPAVLKALALTKPEVPVIWNSGGYEREETVRLLEGAVDIFLPDLKYVSPALSREYSGAEDYFDYASKAILEMARQAGKARYDEEGLLQKGLIVRHLILPGHTNESVRVLEWIASELGSGTLVSLMCQYTPYGRAKEHPKLSRRVTKREYDKVLDKMFALGLDQGFVQERKSAGEEFIPAFDLTGVPGAEK